VGSRAITSRGTPDVSIMSWILPRASTSMGVGTLPQPRSRIISMAFLSPFSKASRYRTRTRASTRVISTPEPSMISSPIWRKRAASSRRRERFWGVRSVILVVTFHTGEQEGSPVEVKVLGVKLDPVRGGFHAEAWADLGTVFDVQRDHGAQGVFDVPAPAIKRTDPELVRNVFLPFRGYFEGAIDWNAIHEGKQARKDMRGEREPMRGERGTRRAVCFLHWPRTILAYYFPNLR